MLWVYDHWKYFYAYSVEIDFSRDVYRRQILTTKVDPRAVRVKSYIAVCFHPLEVVSRYRDPQLKVGENYSYLFNLRLKFANLDV